METFVVLALVALGTVMGVLWVTLLRGRVPAAQKHGFFLAVSSRGKVPVGEVAGFTPRTRAAAAGNSDSAGAR